jgi:hypothetical protein
VISSINTTPIIYSFWLNKYPPRNLREEEQNAGDPLPGVDEQNKYLIKIYLYSFLAL